ncbi:MULTISPECIES: MgtC/SapB family protein [Paenibacillus]|uniref:Methyltransferase n=1 Tax=Paenibacillus azoreducens TaxID=116718 RepID=A0A920CTE4_9BACL|nr:MULTISPECIES: MgtC/SapB family protein [Paenibacillus]MBE9918386.1 MgtC/SapB family protein [Paenibacillus donghaensis]GIO48312.1 methyltransferase [Paenibacillus azoreducens]
MADPWYIDNTHILLRLLLSVLLGGLVGLERERSNHAAGLRTHILVCMGSTLIIMLSIYGFSAFVHEVNIRIDPARLASAVITGVGFLGAGTILFTGKSITGLTTAASIWVIAAVGLAIGAGFYFASIMATLLILLTLVVFNKLEQRYIRSSKLHLISIYATSVPGLMETVSGLLEEEDITVKKAVINERSIAPYGELQPPSTNVEISLNVLSKRAFDPLTLASRIRKLEGVSMVSID